MNLENLWRIVLLAIFATLVWQIVKPKYSLRIAIRDGRVVDHVGIPKSQVAPTIDFLDREVPFSGNALILGSRDNLGLLHLRFRGDIADDLRQQIRNYLKTAL